MLHFASRAILAQVKDVELSRAYLARVEMLAEALGGRVVLIVHDDGFTAAYVASVVQGAGAAILGPVEYEQAGAFLDAEAAIDGLVVGHRLEAERLQALIALAELKRIPVIIIGSSRQPDDPSFNGHRRLPDPFAAYQVVLALRDAFGQSDAGAVA